ncbi:MAG TPA: MFS transporter [Candidatus Binataceae bacterium]|nr:MFS transporter [Candidatus Binataceae bacterium]
MRIRADEAAAALEAAALAKVRRRLLPFLFLLYIVAYLDRINVGFAALRMNRALGLSDAVFGFGAGLFFAGYFIFEIPSNLILARVGARRWIARIMLSWGAAAIAMVAVRGPASFCALRFLLGAAEAGFFPGVILYLTRWFPAGQRARAVALFMTAAAVAGIVAGPVSGALLMMGQTLGMAGWQWLFLLEGVPAIALGIVVAIVLPDGPEDARWLSPGERDALLAMREREQRAARAQVQRLRDGLRDPRVWLLALIYFGLVFGLYGVSFWLPQIVQGFRGSSDFVVGLITAIPFIVAAVAMVRVGAISDAIAERGGDRRRALALCAYAGACGFVLAALARSPILELLAIAIGAGGIFSAFGPFWAIPPEFLGGSAAAGAIALVNSLGNLGGFFGPYAVGVMKESTHSFKSGLAALAIALVVSGTLALTLPDCADA